MLKKDLEVETPKGMSESLREYIDLIAIKDKELVESIYKVYEAGYVKGEKAGIEWGKEMTSNMFKKMREEIK
jgi:hypothetical protein